MIFDIAKLVDAAIRFDNSVKREAFDPQRWDANNMMDALITLGKQVEPRFVVDAANRNCYANLLKWLACDPSFRCVDPTTRKGEPGRVKKGLYLFGPTGTGKTLATKLLSMLASLSGVRIQQAGQQYSLAWSDVQCAALTEQVRRGESIDDVLQARAICFQDLGTEPEEAVYMGNRIQVMRSVIESRGEWGNITIVTSNIPLESQQLRARYGDRAVSRLMGMCNYLVLGGADRRLVR